MPNSFTDLNDYGDEPISFEDARAYSITFSANATSNQTVSVTEDASFYTPAGINILSSQSLPANIVYTVNAASLSSNAIISWNSLPPDVTQTNPSPGVYVVTGPIGNSGWELIKQASFVAKDVTNAFSYTSNIQYPNTANTALTNTWSWTTNVSVTSSHAELSNPTNFVWDEDTTYTITGYPQITDAYSGSLPYTMAITPNTTAAVLTMTTTGGTANSSFDGTTRILTLTGNKTAVNASLANVQVVPIPDYDQNFSFNYSLTNPVSNLNTQVTQLANIGVTNQEWSNSNVARAYFTNLDNYLFANTVPQILETVSGATYTVGLTLNSNIGIITTNTYASPTGWNTGNLTFVTTGNKATVNDTMGNIKFFPSGNITSNTTVAFSSARPGGPAFTDTFALNNFAPPTNAYSITATTTYAEDVAANVRSLITDTPGLNSTYTVTYAQTSGNTGAFILNGAVQTVGANITIAANTLANVNTNTVSFLPRSDDNANIGLAYTQVRTNYLGNVTQANAVAIALSNSGSHDDFTLTTAVNYTEDDTALMTFAITDTDANATSYTSTFAQTTGNTGMFYVNGVAQGVGNSAVISNSKVNINAANVSFLPRSDDTGLVGLTYTQVKTNSIFGNNTQANAIPVTLTCSNTHSDFTLTTSLNYSEDSTVPMVFAITDIDSRATSYTSTFAQSSGNTGMFYVNGIAQGVGNSAVLSNTKVNINAANVSFLPPSDYTGNVGLTYTQVKTNSVFGNNTQANAVAIALTCSNTHSDYSFNSTEYRSNNTDKLNFAVTDQEANCSYTITISDTTVTPGQFYYNSAWQANNAVTLTGNLTQINAANVWYEAYTNYTGNVSLAYTQIKTSPIFGNITQANAVPYTLTPFSQFTLTNAYSFTSTASTPVNLTQTLISGGNSFPETATYSVVFAQTSGSPAYQSSPSFATGTAPPANVTTWTSRTSASTGSTYDAATNGNIIAIVGQGSVQYSSDGITWTSAVSNVTGLSSIIWDGSKWLGTNNGGIYTSTDLTNWTLRYATANTYTLTSIAYSGSLYVAVGQREQFVTSSDGITWTLISSSSTSNILNEVIYANGRFVCVGYSTAGVSEPYNAIAYSFTNPATGISGEDVSGLSGGLRGITWTGTQFVAVGWGGTIATTSTSGTLTPWTQQTSGTSDILQGVAFGNGQIVVTGLSGKTLTSFNGISWTSATVGSEFKGFVRNVKNLMVAGGDSGELYTRGTDSDLATVSYTIPANSIATINALTSSPALRYYRNGNTTANVITLGYSMSKTRTDSGFPYINQSIPVVSNVAITLTKI